MRPIRWLRRNVVVVAGVLALGYLVLPNVVVLVFSFNKPKGRYNYTWNHFSTDAWQHPCGVADMCGSLSLSLRLAVYATIGATLLGTMTAFALARYRFRGRAATNMLIFLPMAMPEVVMGASLGTLFLNMRIRFGFWTILIAHIMFCLSFVVVAVKARVMSMDPRLEQAAQDLYATPAQTFLRVTLPLAEAVKAIGAEAVYACGPADMLRAVTEVATAEGARSFCAVEQGMACAAGVCMTCVLPVVGEDGVSRFVRSCVDGPCFDGTRVRWTDIGTIPADLDGAAAMGVH